MKKWTMVLVALAVVMLIAPSAFAQETGAAAGGGKGLMAIAAGFGMALAAFGGALGQGQIASAACEGSARNARAPAAHPPGSVLRAGLGAAMRVSPTVARFA